MSRVCLGVGVVLFFWAGSAQAYWQLQVEFRSAIDSQTIDQLVEENWAPLEASESFTVPDIRVTQEGVPVAITGIVGRVEYKIDRPVRGGSGLEWNAESNYLRTTLTIGQVHASTTIREEFNGGVIIIRVEGNCYNVQLSIPEAAGAKATATVVAKLEQGNLRLSTTESSVDWPDSAWQVDSLNCNGDSGFGEIVRNAILENLSQPQQEVQDGLHAEIQKRMDAWAKDVMDIAVTPRLVFQDRQDAITHTIPGKLGDLTDGQISLEGKMRLLMTKVAPGEKHLVEHFFKSNSSFESSSSETQFPVSSLKSFVMAAFFEKAFKSKWDTHEFKPFAELMQNRVNQALAWPDLTNFKKDSNFIFRTNVMAAPNLYMLRNATQLGAILGEFSVPLTVVMWAPDKKTHVPYVQFRGHIRGTAHMEIIGGKLKINTFDVQAIMDYGWNKRYVEAHKPSKRIEIGEISKRLAKGIMKETITVDLPHWEWQASQNLFASGMTIQGDVLRISWENESIVLGDATDRTFDEQPVADRGPAVGLPGPNIGIGVSLPQLPQLPIPAPVQDLVRIQEQQEQRLREMQENAARIRDELKRSQERALVAKNAKKDRRSLRRRHRDVLRQRFFRNFWADGR